MDEDESRAARPNSVFLARVLQGNQRGNQREIDTNASRAAQKAVGASGAASIRPSLTRSAKKGPEAIRRTALSAAQEQKLILCTALLKEVARLYGFRLSVCHGFSTSSPSGAEENGGPSGTAAAPAAPGGEQMDVQGDGAGDGPGAVEHQGQQQQQQQHQEDGRQEGRANQDELQDLQVSLKLPAISVDTWADDEEEEDEGEEGEENERGRIAKGKLRHAAAPTPRGSAVLSGLRARAHTPQQVHKLIRPKLASNALSSLGLALRKAAAPPSSTIGEAKQRRVSSAKADDGAEEKEDGAAAQQPTSHPRSPFPTLSRAPKFVGTASPLASSQSPAAPSPAPMSSQAPAAPEPAPAPMEDSQPAPTDLNPQVQLPVLPPALMQHKTSPSLPPQQAPGPPATDLQLPSHPDHLQDHARIEGTSEDGCAREGEEDGESGTPSARSNKKRRGGKGSGRGSTASGGGDLTAGGGDSGQGQPPPPASSNSSMPPTEGQPAASTTPAAAATAAAPSSGAAPTQVPAVAAAAGPAPQQQTQPSAKRTPAQGLFGAAMRDLKKVKPGGAGKAVSAAKDGGGDKKEDGQG
ncbi:hypothetical protein DUNSADRAFT_13013 [Dunaliella salina]|uniref:Uncharacterized protein n=1 Tax=Dunaliella salina TaxID=3046 RepID=A0ABQ7GA87_DUNSA|nr:hypothetical protein DUNSADRAFT_13013 [Dunaliella salina]|eukprot:KAF5831509.1 hypothetical protein DUNSADRAFT_13013 [Dunaliella salina]